MDRSEVLGRLQGVFREVFNDGELTINETSSSADILDWDSLAHIRLILAVETEFACQFQTDEIASFENVGDLVSATLAQQG